MSDYCLLEISIGDRTVRSVEPIERGSVLERVQALDHCTLPSLILADTERKATPIKLKLREEAFAEFTRRFQDEATELFKAFDTFNGYKVEK